MRVHEAVWLGLPLVVNAAGGEWTRLAAACAPGVKLDTLSALIETESGGNPFAIGVVGGHLARQPRNRHEAVASADALERGGFNFSLGLGQINRANLVRYGASFVAAFDPCRNLSITAAIFGDCYRRARAGGRDERMALRAALSCYYSGNFTRGFRPDSPRLGSYVERVSARLPIARDRIRSRLTNGPVPWVIVFSSPGAAVPSVEGREANAGMPPRVGAPGRAAASPDGAAWVQIYP